MSEEQALNITFDDGEEEVTSVAPEVVEEETTEEPEQTEEGGETDEEGVRVEFTPEQQAKVDEIARKAASRNFERLQALMEENERLKGSQPQQQEPGRPVVPDPPDPFDDDYLEKLQARDKALQQVAKWEAAQEVEGYYKQQQQRQMQERAVEELNKTVKSYADRAKKIGVKADDLKIAGQQVGAVGLDASLIEHILTDDAGPSITMYLAANYGELDKIKGMSPVRAAAYIEGTIKPKAAQRTTKAPPPPVDSPRGGGMPEGNIGPKGTVYE